MIIKYQHGGTSQIAFIYFEFISWLELYEATIGLFSGYSMLDSLSTGGELSDSELGEESSYYTSPSYCNIS